MVVAPLTPTTPLKGLRKEPRVPLYERWRRPEMAQLIKGNTSLEVKQRILELCASHFTMCGRAFGDGILSRLEIVEANAWKDRDEARVVCELDVEEDMTDANGNVPGSCFAFLTSLFSGLPHIVLDLSKGGTGAKGAAQVLSTTIHRNAHIGDRLKIYGRTMSRDFAVTFGRYLEFKGREARRIRIADEGGRREEGEDRQ